jgi:pimeloyl-ACP methyl ester carboxylesterase
MPVAGLMIALSQLTMVGPPLPASRASELRWDPHVIELADQRRVPAEIAYLTVPERRGSTAARPVRLALIRLRGRNPMAGRPTLYLGGSPGGASASLRFPWLFAFFDRLRDAGDVIVLDYRGSGLSAPRLECPPVRGVRPGMFASRASALEGFAANARRCAAALASAGVDLAGYTWAEIAADVADVASALEVPSVNILGFSSGTHAAFATMRAYPGVIDRTVLVGSEGPDHTRKLPAGVDRQLEAIAGLVAASPEVSRAIPNLLALVRSVLERLEREPMSIEITDRHTGRTVRELVGRFAVEFITAKHLSGPEEFGLLPRLYHSLASGDPGVLQRIVQRFADRSAPNPLSYVLDGASGVSASRRAVIEAQARTALTRDAVNFPFPEICEAWKCVDLGVGFREPIAWNRPTLFVTGSLDGNTPAAQAEEIRRGFPASHHLIVENGGHDAPLRSPEAAMVIARFLAGGDVSGARVELPAPRFSLSSP